MVQPLAYFIGVLSISVVSSVAGEETREWDKNYQHKQTEIIFPAELAGFQVTKITDFAASEFDGSNLGLTYKDGGTTLNVYLYSVDAFAEPDREIKALNEALAAVRHYAAEGKYQNLKIPDDLDVIDFGGEEHPHRMVATTFTLSQSDEESTTEESYAGVTIVDGFVVKIRHSMELTGEGKKDEAVRKRREGAVDFIISMIKEADFRPLVDRSIKTLRENPEDPDAASVVVAFTEASKLLQVKISAELLPFLQNDQFDSGTALLASFISGNIEEQLRELSFISQDLAGVKRMLEAYATLRSAGKCSSHEILDRWTKEIKAGTFELPESGKGN